MLALPLISLAVFLLVLAGVILSLLCRNSAKRTVTVRDETLWELFLENVDLFGFR